ncbi:hypothetical protein HNQ34_003325 [Anoxybacillus tepidamans]|uniref:Uncharacterized protein n=1 Tax=Anoxybacteroides tepidamans TaxID=265948 RepID=A0A7W8IUP2_9BACL|nr:hypothetical protein [Anoxybacillus tepidamans]MBB5326206.1 hypothetical protein [Anoxybacillus tepidamans]
MKKKRGDFMPIAFTPDEIIKANKLLEISQKKLKEEIAEKERLAIDFSEGILGVILSYDLYKKMVEQIEELEEKIMELEIAEILAKRNPDHQETKWIAYEEGSILKEFQRIRNGNTTTP